MDHTPGPWKVIGMYGQFPRQTIAVEQRSADSVSHICEVSVGRASETARKQAMANAQLIAAAPDLLAACKAVVAAYSSHQLYDKCPLDQLKAAIAKAEGK